MIKGFILVCADCNAKGLLEESVNTHIHNEYGKLTFKCFSCGSTANFEPDMRAMPSEKQQKLLREKQQIEELLK